MSEFKLYSEYKKCLQKIVAGGGLKAAWFTTFNIKMQFVEKYILPPLLNMNPGPQSEDNGEPQPLPNCHIPQSERDYEVLNQQLRAEDAPSIRVFCDASMIDIGDKRTTLPVIPINASELELPYEREAKGVFHPKVIFLLGATCSFLICGSANLTRAGWASNRECVQVLELGDDGNPGEVRAFFQRLDADEWRSSVEGHFNKWMCNNPRGERGLKWEFVHTLRGPKPNLWNAWLSRSLDGEELTVWSPYFGQASYLVKAIRKINGADFSIRLVPNVNGNGKIDISGDEGKDLMNLGVQFRKDVVSGGTERFSHAKVWLCGDTVAIGSWNFTGAGTGLPGPDHVENIEAGVLVCNPDIRQALPKLDDWNDVIEVCQEDYVKSEPQSDPGQIKVIPLYFSWKTKCFNWVGPSQEKQKYKIYLNGDEESSVSLAKCICNGLPAGKMLVKHLKNDRFINLYSNGQRKGCAVVVETDLALRPVLRCGSLEEALMSWLKPDDRPPGELPHGGGSGGGGGESAPYDVQRSLFRLFMAMKGLKRCVKNAVDSYDPESLATGIDSLEALCEGLPGSLDEIRERVLDAVQNYSDDQRVYYWFLLNELATIAGLLDQPGKKRKLGRLNKFGKEMRTELLHAAENILHIDGRRTKDLAWVERVAKVCEYEC